MADIFSKEKRSAVMALIRSKNTKPEIALRKLVSAALYPRGYRYRINYRKLPGSPDVAFVSQKVAVFVDGAFWHGFDFRNKKKKLPKRYWLPKIEKNMARDKRVNRELRKLGWCVIRIWEHELQRNPGKVLGAIEKAIRS